MPIMRDAAGERTSFGRRRRRRGLIGRDRHRALSVAPLTRPCTRVRCARTRVARLPGHPPVYGVSRVDPRFFSHVFVITIIRPSQKETSPPVNPRSGFKHFFRSAPEPPKKQSYVYFEPFETRFDWSANIHLGTVLWRIFIISKTGDVTGINYD